MRWIVFASVLVLGCASAADAPAPKAEKSDAGDSAQTDDLVIAPKSAIVLRSGVLAPSGESNAKPVIVYDKNALTIGPAVAKADNAPKAAEGKDAQAPKPAEKPKDDPKKPSDEDRARTDYNRLPVLRLPIQFPSTSITSAGGPNGRFQVTGDAQIETREIIAPLPLGTNYWQPTYTTRVPFAYGKGSDYEKAQAAQPKK